MTRSIDDAFINAYRGDGGQQSPMTPGRGYRPRRVTLKRGFLASVLGGQDWYVDSKADAPPEPPAEPRRPQARPAADPVWFDDAAIVASMPAVEVRLADELMADPAQNNVGAPPLDPSTTEPKPQAPPDHQAAARHEQAQDQIAGQQGIATEANANSPATIAEPPPQQRDADHASAADSPAPEFPRRDAPEPADAFRPMLGAAMSAMVESQAPAEAARQEATAEAPEVAEPAAHEPELRIDEPHVAASETTGAEQAERPQADAPAAEDAAGPEILRMDAPQTEPPPPFNADWEVDCFHWPAVCENLKSLRAEALQQAGDELTAAAAEGLATLLVTSACRGEGRSTVALCLARAAAESGARVALVDADLDNPSLADFLNLRLEQDWRQAVFGGGRLEDAVIASIDDQLTLAPLMRDYHSADHDLKDERVGNMLRNLAHEFDLVVIDGGPIGLAERLLSGESGPVDAVVVVRDQRSTTEEEVSRCVQAIRDRKVAAVGIAENFSGRPVTAVHV